MSSLAAGSLRRVAAWRWVDVVIAAGLTALAVMQMAAAVSSSLA